MNSMANRTVVRLKDFRVGDVSSKVSSAVSSLADQLVHGVEDWTTKARNAAKSTDGFVRSSPWQAIGVIALAGVAAGMLVSRSARRARMRAANTPNAESTSEVLGG